MAIFTQSVSAVAANNDIFQTTYIESEETLVEDPLLLSCTLKRLVTDEPTNYSYSLTNKSLKEKITDDDRVYAENVRDYYCKQWFWASLNSSRNLSKFRHRAFYLMSNRIRTVKQDDIGIYYKMPWFYDEDMIYNDLKAKYVTKDLPVISYPRNKERIELEYIKSTISTQKNRKLERFWFTNGTYLYTIQVQRDNPLLTMFRNMIEPGKTVSLETRIREDRIDQFYFYSLYDFNF